MKNHLFLRFRAEEKEKSGDQVGPSEVDVGESEEAV